jgi:hypothetical protein
VLIKKKFYAFPRKLAREVKYFAFYNGGTISYYAEVRKMGECGKQDVGVGYWLRCLPDAEPPFQIARFCKIKKLRNPIKKENEVGRGHIQGRLYTTMKILLNARKISDLRRS